MSPLQKYFPASCYFPTILLLAHIMPILKLLITVSNEMSQIRQIRVHFISNKCIRFSVKKLSALAFIPVEDLIMVYEALADTFEENELELISYFEATWNSRVVGRKQQRTPARFPAAMWNFVGRHFTGSTRTRNALEAFHQSFTSLVACQHPSIWVLLKSLQRQQVLTDMLSHIAQGETKLPGTRERERARNARIATHVSAYDRSDPEKNFTRDCI